MMAIEASLAGSRADCVRERLRDCGPGAIQRRRPRRKRRIDVKRRPGEGGGRWACSVSNAGPASTLASFALLAANSGRHAPPRPCPPDELRVRMAVRPARGGRGAMAQAFLGLAADPLDAVQQREAGQRSGIAWRPPVEEEKHEERDAGQHGEPGDRHITLSGRLRGGVPLLLRASKVGLVVLMGTGCTASLIGDEAPWVPESLAAGGQNGPSIARRCRKRQISHWHDSVSGRKARGHVLEERRSIASAVLGVLVRPDAAVIYLNPRSERTHGPVR